jgi:hypothetical protein
MPVDDYYSLIGVSPDADRDTIRDAYRSRRSELDDSEGGRSSAAKLNRAWNVLSDSAQRAKYDDQLAEAKADDDVVVPELVGATRASSNGRGSSGTSTRGSARGGRERPERARREPIPQTAEINGITLASNRDRAFSLVTDAILCVLILVVGVSFLAGKLSDGRTDKSIPPKLTYIDVKHGNKTVNDNTEKQINKYVDDLQDKLDNQDQANIDKYIKLRDAKGTSAADKKKYNDDKTHWQNVFDADQKAQTKARDLLDPIGRGVLFGAGVLALLVFVVPAALTGRTLGKALRKTRLMKEDAVTPAGWQASFVRYGVIIGFIVLAGVFLGQFAQIAWIVAIFGVTSFSRNAKRQGWHDRIAHTVVVEG